MRWLFAGAVVATWAAAAHAHALHVTATVEIDAITVTAVFDGGFPAVGAAITVWDADGKLIAHGTVDADGRGTTTPLGGTPYRVRVDAGAGHVAEIEYGAATRRINNQLRLVAGVAWIVGMAWLVRRLLRKPTTP